LSVAG
jgi:hypothetical protein